MGRKVHPIGYRLGVIKPWSARWFAKDKKFSEYLNQDLEIRKMMAGIFRQSRCIWC